MDKRLSSLRTQAASAEIVDVRGRAPEEEIEAVKAAILTKLTLAAANKPPTT